MLNFILVNFKSIISKYLFILKICDKNIIIFLNMLVGQLVITLNHILTFGKHTFWIIGGLVDIYLTVQIKKTMAVFPKLLKKMKILLFITYQNSIK